MAAITPPPLPNCPCLDNPFKMDVGGHQHKVVTTVSAYFAAARLLLEVPAQKSEGPSWISEVIELVRMAVGAALAPTPVCMYSPLARIPSFNCFQSSWANISYLWQLYQPTQ